MLLLTSCQQICMTYTIAVCTVKNSYDRQRNSSKHVEFHSKNKFEKLVHLVGFIIRNVIDSFVFVTELALRIVENFKSHCLVTQTVPVHSQQLILHSFAYIVFGFQTHQKALVIPNLSRDSRFEYPCFTL